MLVALVGKHSNKGRRREITKSTDSRQLNKINHQCTSRFCAWDHFESFKWDHFESFKWPHFVIFINAQPKFSKIQMLNYFHEIVNSA